MKRILVKTLFVSIGVLLLPFLLTLLLSNSNGKSTLESLDFSIYYDINGTREALTFDEYLIGVVAANMPAGYHMEALKAQAVIARTYALYNISLLRETSPHRNSFSTSELGLSYIDLNTLEQFWGTKEYKNYFTKLENAVFGTQDEIITYDYKLILPVFFDTGSGFTRNAFEAWGVKVPYLISVPSKQDVTSTGYLNIKEFEINELITLLEGYYAEINLNPELIFEQVTVTERDSIGYVTKIDLDGLTVSGEEFAKVLGLNSNHFYIEDYEGLVRIICNGSGHGIGLSQFGANAMALEGATYQEILTHYYTGISLTHLSNEY